MSTRNRVLILFTGWALLFGAALLTKDKFILGVSAGWGLGWAVRTFIADNWPETGKPDA